GFIQPNVLSSNLLRLVPDATLYHFGVLTSIMHMAWTRAICGRLEMRYRYSKDLVYNNYPWPTPTINQQSQIEQLAQKVLDTRTLYPGATLADLYDPLTMPSELTKAHQRLDKAVDAAYGKTTFKTEADRVAFLFELYQQYVGNGGKGVTTPNGNLRTLRNS
ncbi:MAG: hypothetical protein PHH81_12260, partial [Bacteroides graminisolvens]|nr:hypothetical protein [Bacteroides graminisolvens]